MKREIKFRAYDTQLKTFSYSGYGKITFSSFVKRTNCDRYIITQYTGLKDKEGKEIYEWDIIRIHEGMDDFKETVIIWNNNLMRFEPKNRKLRFEIEAAYEDYYEVIGNIFENPELLEQ